ncbi:unnamed protein product [Mytilus edulis]|uniref:Uncharacterized protein n=1 Tax=Mytilus edulis TaxID=6550 RepID=A0A8S3PVC8_MYTED|nr:unnamed protein product [Mytilus edulis]
MFNSLYLPFRKWLKRGHRKDSRIEKIKETNEKKVKKKEKKSIKKKTKNTIKVHLLTLPIKKESSAFNYRGVWKLIDPFKFKKQPKFSDALHEAWRKLTGLTIDPEIDGTDFLLESLVKVIKEKIDKDIFLMKCTENVLIKTGRKTTVSDMITRVINKDSNETLVPGEEEIEKNLVPRP